MIVFVAVTFLILIVLLNMLIAIMGYTFEISMDNRDKKMKQE